MKILQMTYLSIENFYLCTKLQRIDRLAQSVEAALVCAYSLCVQERSEFDSPARLANREQDQAKLVCNLSSVTQQYNLVLATQLGKHTDASPGTLALSCRPAHVDLASGCGRRLALWP